MPQEIPSVKLLDGRSMPILGLGTYADETSGDREKVEQAVYDAISLGYRHIDTAYLYKVEENVGRGAKRAIDEGIVKREDLFIVTKVWMYNLSRERLLAQAKQSNEKLGLGYIDLLLVHFPIPLKDTGKYFRGMFPLDENGEPAIQDEVDIYNETWRAMEETVDLGISKSIGVSNYNISQLKTLLEMAKIKPVTNQVECHPYLQQKKLIAFAKEHGVTITAYSPFGGGLRRNDKGELQPVEFRQDLWEEEAIKSLAAKYNKTVNQILLRFQIDRGVIVIPKTVNKDRLVENANIFDFSLTPEDLASLDALDSGKRRVELLHLTSSKYYPFHEE